MNEKAKYLDWLHFFKQKKWGNRPKGVCLLQKASLGIATFKYAKNSTRDRGRTLQTQRWHKHVKNTQLFDRGENILIQNYLYHEGRSSDYILLKIRLYQYEIQLPDHQTFQFLNNTFHKRH